MLQKWSIGTVSFAVFALLIMVDFGFNAGAGIGWNRRLAEPTDVQITAWESGVLRPPIWMLIGPNTQDAPPPVSRKKPWTKEELIKATWQAARTWNIHPQVFVRLVERESKWKIRARSPLKFDPGRGLTQLRCLTTARGLGYKEPCYYLQRNPLVSLYYGAKYLRQLVERYGNYRSAVAAYYAGPKRWNDLVKGKLKYKESKILWAKVSDYLDEVIPKFSSATVKATNRCHERIKNAACIWRTGETYEQSIQREMLVYN